MNLGKEFLRSSLSIFGLGLLASISSLGCPIYSDQVGCYKATDCDYGQHCSAAGLCVEGLPYLDDAGTQVTIDAAATLDASADGPTKDAAGKDAAGLDGEAEVIATGDGTSPVYCGSPNDCATAETCGADG